MGTSTKLLHEHNLQKSFMSSQKSSIRLSSKSVANSRKRLSAASVNKNNNNNNNNTVIKTRSNAKQQLQNQLTEEPIADKCKPKKSSTKNRSTAAVAKSMERGPSKRINNKSNNIDSSISLKNLNNNNQINKNNNNNNSSLNFDDISATTATATATTTKPSSNATTTTKSKSNQKSIERKIQTKTGRTKRKYLCDFCKKEFLGGNDLRKHIRIHTNERPFECTHCGQKFRQGGCLKNHIASQHGTTQTFTCYYCEKTFPIKERLRLHMRLHSGERPYKCDICDKRFARGGQVQFHSFYTWCWSLITSILITANAAFGDSQHTEETPVREMSGLLCVFDELQIAFETSFEWTWFNVSSVRQIVHTSRCAEKAFNRFPWESESFLLPHLQSNVQRSSAATHANTWKCQNIRMLDVRLIFLAKVTIDCSPKNPLWRTPLSLSGKCAFSY